MLKLKIKITLCAIAMLSCIVAAAPQQRPLAQSIRPAIAAALDELERAADFAAAQSRLLELFQQVIAFGSPRDLDAFRDAAFSLRLVRQLRPVPAEKRIALLKYLRANDELARTLVFLVDPKNSLPDVFSLLDRLREARGDQPAKFPALTAAICLVHDRRFQREFLGYRLRSPDPQAIFDYFVANDGKLLRSTRALPPELVMYLVDTTSPIDEMSWALKNYAGNRYVGRLFFDVRYDVEHWETGAMKRIDKEKYTLPNLIKLGGVCGDQAYFAAAVGKSIGVPAAMVRGANAETGHYWCGFFQFAGRPHWNFEIGRYDAYQGLRGGIIDPQTREEIPDTFVALLALLAQTPAESRQTGRAVADAALHMMEMQALSRDLPDHPPAGAEGLTRREPGTIAELELVELAVRASPGDRFCWEPLRQLAAAGRLTLDMKKYWSDALAQVCGTQYPDFVLAMLTPMVKTVENPAEQMLTWDWVCGIIKSRSDLVAQVRMEQAALCESLDRLDRAAEYYSEIIENYANSGPFVIDALQMAEKILVKKRQPEKVLKLYEQTWSRMRRPREIAGPFVTQSNWYRVGQMLAAEYEEAGKKPKADSIREQLGGKQ